ncbi:MAG: hypothetical protein Unbinned2514contig1000_39 [Prokaryotic dsDNA virus sp.]|nr:MAG: hypothetical protein Unbinned2514contig1000_39 [Prokaryotic dsDNA virus sp.]|tara:strand:- start:7685 stop:8080 length:396 start_codon:yes stop_codon:yes gene_type:complete
MSEKELKDKYESAGKRALMILIRCKNLFKGDGLYIPALVADDDGPGAVGWSPTSGFWCDSGDGERVATNSPLDGPRLSATLSAIPKLYDEARRLRDLHRGLLEKGADDAESFLSDITKKRTPEKEPPKWTP